MVYRAASGTAASHVGLRLKIAASLSGQCVLTAEILRCDDAETDPRVDLVACRQVGAMSMIVVPLQHEHQVVGVLKVYSPEAHAFGTEAVCTLQLMAGLIGAAMAHASEFEAKQELLVDLERRVKERTAQLEHQALHDALTDLPNWTLLRDRLEQAIRSSRRQASSFALLLLDLDRFKDVNDTFGHHQGDVILQQVGPRFRSALRESDTIARLSGDEFAVLLPGTDDLGASVAAERLLRTLDRQFSLEGQSFDIGASVGIVVYPGHGADANTLLRRADVAMYAAKRSDGGYAVYAPEDDQYSAQRLALMRDLRWAIEHDQLLVYYQPKLHLRTGSVLHVEALARWHHPELGFIPPDQFIPLAERGGLIKPLTLRVLPAALRQCRAWYDAGLKTSVAVNLSARSLHDEHLVGAIARLIRASALSPTWLTVEITESAVMTDPLRAREILTRLHDMGVSISIDDYGTVYSSLSYLARLSVDEIKIDRSFVMNMATNSDDASIVRSVTDLGHSLGLEVVAEGVENQDTLALLAGVGCDLIQGYYLSRPLPAAELTAWYLGERHKDIAGVTQSTPPVTPISFSAVQASREHSG